MIDCFSVLLQHSNCATASWSFTEPAEQAKAVVLDTWLKALNISTSRSINIPYSLLIKQNCTATPGPRCAGSRHGFSVVVSNKPGHSPAAPADRDLHAVGRCSLPVSNSVLKAPTVSALETRRLPVSNSVCAYGFSA
jgi:hypothetical protein